MQRIVPVQVRSFYYPLICRATLATGPAHVPYRTKFELAKQVGGTWKRKSSYNVIVFCLSIIREIFLLILLSILYLFAKKGHIPIYRPDLI